MECLHVAPCVTQARRARQRYGDGSPRDDRRRAPSMPDSYFESAPRGIFCAAAKPLSLNARTCDRESAGPGFFSRVRRESKASRPSERFDLFAPNGFRERGRLIEEAE